MKLRWPAFTPTLRERGYKSPVLSTAMGAIGLALPILITFALLGYGHDQAIWLLLALFAAMPFVLRGVARSLPRRNARTAGQRQLYFPYRSAGYVLSASAPLLWLMGAVTGTNGWAQFGTVSLAGGLACFAIARRAAQPDAATVMAQDTRPPVVYLRPFQQDEEVFARVPWTWNNYRRWITNNYLRRNTMHQTLEEYLGEEISARLGPFVALGNPADFVPPAGAARVYVADQDWTQHFHTMVQKARCIVLVAASSEHVVWELTQIRSLRLESKLFVLTAATSKAGGWSTFSGALRQAGYPPCGDDAGPGAVVAFKPGGEPVILKRNAKTAAETVEVICRRVGFDRGSTGVRPGSDH